MSVRQRPQVQAVLRRQRGRAVRRAARSARAEFSSPARLALRAAALLLAVVVGLSLWHRRVERARRMAFDGLIREAACRNHVSPALVKGIVRQESDFNRWALGSKGEIGLMQVTEGAAIDWARAPGHRLPSPGMRFDPRINVEIGAWYLGQAMAKWRAYTDVDTLALAQYNAGQKNAARWAPADPASTGSLDRIDFPSTREYVRRVRRYARVFEEEFRQREQDQSNLGASDASPR